MKLYQSQELELQSEIESLNVRVRKGDSLMRSKEEESFQAYREA